MEIIKKGVCAPKGFSANGIHAGIRKNKDKKDLAAIVSSFPCSVGCVYTKNKVKGAPLYVTKQHLKNGVAQGIICNSGNANTCNLDGITVAKKMCSLMSKHTGIPSNDIIVASTGVIGQPLDVARIEENIEELIRGLGEKSGLAQEAIMTTDTSEKEIAVKFIIEGVECKIGGIAKGSGMINPNMATMLAFLTTDCNISTRLLQKAITASVTDTYNMVSVDGDSSTNDMVCVLANGQAGNKKIAAQDKSYKIFVNVLTFVNAYLSKLIAKDGEGATKLIECKVESARCKKEAKSIAKSVISSSLVKTAMFGADANWGRVLCAIGYSGAKDASKVDVAFCSAKGQIDVCKRSRGIAFCEERAKTILSENEIRILINMNLGKADATAWGCDLTYDYVKINGDYRT